MKQKCFTNFKSIYEVLDYKEQDNNNNLYLLKQLEKIVNLVLEKDKKYKEEPKLKYIYFKIKLANTQIKFQLIRKNQLNKMRESELEKNKLIIEHHQKIRFIPLNKNGINLKYYHKNNHLSVSSKKKDELINKKKIEDIKNLICFY